MAKKTEVVEDQKSPMLIKVMGMYGGRGYRILEDVQGEYLIMGDEEGNRVRLSYKDGYGGGGVKEYKEDA